MVFIDYESSQKALNKPENNKIVNKLAIFSDSSENTKVALNKIKKLKLIGHNSMFQVITMYLKKH